VIVTVTLNPALHVGYEALQVSLGRANQVSRVRYRAGGRGLAVARVLHTFGHDVTAAGLAGGAAGEMIRADLAASGIATQFTRIAMESRRVLEVAEASSGRITTFGEPAPYITTEELGRLAADYRDLMSDATAVVLCGSLPAGLPPETYGTLATYAAEAGVPAILDAGGRALLPGLARRPALVIPELPAEPGPESYQEPDDRASAVTSGARVPAFDPAAAVAAGTGAVVLLSNDVVRVVTAAGEWRAWLPAEAGLTRSRDALVAGFVPGIALGWSWPDMLTHAVAIAAAADPAGEVDLDLYEALLADVRVDPPAGEIGPDPRFAS
jgi:tagatose 6-phosphate kinase